LWSIRTGECEATKEAHWDGVQGCAVTPDGSILVTASYDSILRLWNIDSMECIAMLAGHKDDVNDCVVAPDGSVIVSASDDKTLKVWEASLQWPVKPISPGKVKCKIDSGTNNVKGFRAPPALRWLYGMQEFINFDDIPTTEMMEVLDFGIMNQKCQYEMMDDFRVLKKWQNLSN